MINMAGEGFVLPVAIGSGSVCVVLICSSSACWINVDSVGVIGNDVGTGIDCEVSDTDCGVLSSSGGVEAGSGSDDRVGAGSGVGGIARLSCGGLGCGSSVSGSCLTIAVSRSSSC